VSAVSFHAGLAPPVRATAPNATCRAPSECVVEVGTTWHSVQANGFDVVFAPRCDWCAPTPRREVAVPPAVSTGGAACGPTSRVASPWQLWQLCWEVSTLPSWCVPFGMIAFVASTVVGWQPLHAVLAGCERPVLVVVGGNPWHVAQPAPERSSVPLLCCAVIVPFVFWLGWHLKQEVSCECGAGGG
jgi:hypothetical protein